MKRFCMFSMVLGLGVCLAASDTFARGPGGGGRPGGGGGGGGRPGGGGGGMSRPGGSGGGSMSRPSTGRPGGGAASFTPSMSRAGGSSGMSRPSMPSQGSRPNVGGGGGMSFPPGGHQPNIGGNRPSTGGNRPDIGGNRPNIGGDNRPNFSGNNRPTQGQLNDFLGLPGNAGPSTRPATPNRPNAGDRPIAGNRPNIDNRPNIGDKTNIGNKINNGNININRQNNVNNIRNQWNNVADRPFDHNWWNNHPHINNPAWRWQAGWNRYPGYWGWRAASWAAFGTWFAWGAWSQPMVYDYGSNVVYTGDNVYVDGQQTATADQYYQQADTIADSIPANANPDKVEWMPLGVFSMASEDGTDSHMMVQLAVSKEGIIAGTFYNETSDTSRPVQGMVDRQSQRASWKFADGKNTDVVMETGINNLTKDESTALVHYGPDKTQTMLMVRLPAPEDKKDG